MPPQTFNIRFAMRTERKDQAGKAPIYAIVTINGNMLYFSLHRKALVKDWLTGKNKLKSHHNKENKAINAEMEVFRSKIYQARASILVRQQQLNTAALKDEISGIGQPGMTTGLLATAILHNRNFKQLVGIKYSQGSYKNYKTTLKYLSDFIPQYYRKKDMPLQKADYKFCEAYFSYLTTKKNCKQNGANKQIQRLKKIINYAIKQGLININPLASYTLEFTPVNKIALTMQELEQLQAVEPDSESLRTVKDVFLLQCYTGLTYGDVKRLSATDIHRKGQEEYWIKMDRQKTKVAFSVPLLPQAMAIINKYFSVNDGDRVASTLMPVLSNQKMNAHLKLIQELAGISKNLTTHLGRHTFSTTITLGNGVPIETVSRMLGHTKLSTTQLYAKVLETKIAEDMQNLKTRLSLQQETNNP